MVKTKRYVLSKESVVLLMYFASVTLGLKIM